MLLPRYLYPLVRRNSKCFFVSLRHLRTRRNLKFDQNALGKPNVWNYFSKREITTLFVLPLCVIVVYVCSMWQIFKYTCNVKDIEDFVKRMRWIRQ